jgi:DNA segregation ATPase FtsK/SpoIIIE, S-DNA-T family
MRSAVILRFTVQDVNSREGQDVEVFASADDSVGALLDALPVKTDGATCFVGAAPLDRRSRLADSLLLSGAVLSVGGAGPDYQPVRGGAAGTLHVIAGPDVGFGVVLRPGRHAIGRAADADVCLHDDEVSREHAVIEVSPDGGARIWDADSRNGTFVDGAPIRTATPLANGSVVRIGPDELRWAPGGGGALQVTQAAGGRLEFDRVFAPVPAIPAAEVELPPPGPDSRNATSMVTSAVIGLAMGPALFEGTHNALALLASLAGPIAPFMTYAVEGRQRKKAKRAIAKARVSAQDQITALAAEEDRVRHLLAPGPADIVAMAAGARADLWPRDARSPQGLALRVGVTDQPPSVRLRGQPWDGFDMPVLRGVPVTVDLRETGVLGVSGTGETARALLRWLLVQLVTLRSPDDLRIVLLTAGRAEDMRWARWLPHVDQGTAASQPCLIGNTDDSRAARIEELGRLIDARRAERDGGSASQPDGEVVVVLDGALALRNLPGMREILRRGPDVGVYVVCADSHGMNECRGLCDVTSDGIRLIRTPNAPVATAIPDGIDTALAEQVARALAPMRDRASGVDGATAIPYPVRLLDLMGIGVPTAYDILALWRDKEEGPQTRVVIGADAAGPVTVDLAAPDQGPHAMLAGAPGAGKSILLQTLVTALLMANRPDELNFVLVDFKGGGAFLPFENCPHVTALITSVGETAADTFTEADAARVLASVRAEMNSRESVLRRYNAEIDDYWQARKSRPDLKPLPRVVMIFDEFARVLETSPLFLKELVSVAAKGRSLGVHLVLATQALQGKLNPELKNNISLRISLRQNEPAESTEVLGAPDAATIPGALRGRGMILRTGAENKAPRAFQSGYLGNPPPAGSVSRMTVRPLAWADLGAPRPAAKISGDGAASDQKLAIAAVEEAARRAQVAAPYRVLLPKLPTSFSLDQLAGRQSTPAPDAGVPFGLVDEPNLQAQPPCYLDLAATERLMVAGGPQSGRTTFARTLITSLVTRFRPDQVHLYVVEHQPAGLAEYTPLPHCGGVFAPAEPDRVRRLVGWLAAETQRRAAARFEAAGRDNPLIVVVIDGWEQFESRANPALADVSLGPALREIMTIGPPLGVHIAAIGGQDLLTGKVPGLCDRRLLLPFPNEDTRRSHLRGGMASPPTVPGRAIDAATGRHIQICQPGITGTELVSRLAARYEPAALDTGRLPRLFPSLPSRIGVEDLALPSPLPSPSWTPLGVGGPDVAAVGVDLFHDGPHVMLISGSQGSGRSTAIATLARLLSWHGIDVLAIAPPRSPLSRMLAADEYIRVVTGATIEDGELRAAAESFGDHRYAVLVDDADSLTVQAVKQGFGETPTLLDEIARPAELGHRALVIAADATPILAGNRKSLAKPVNEALNNGIRLLLTPAKRADARLLNMSMEPDQYFTRPAGRGYLATAGAPTLIQLVLAE